MELREIIGRLLDGEIQPDQAERLLEQEVRRRSYEEYVQGFARLDVYRDRRTGIPEVIYAESKEPKEAAELLIRMAQERGWAMATRVGEECLKEIQMVLPPEYEIKAYPKARVIAIRRTDFHPESPGGRIGILAAGTADIPVAEEARAIACEMGCEVISAYDVGVAGIHRLLEPLKDMLEKEAVAIVVVAGMEGALPTVVRSLVDVPVIGVPTSVGYGYGGKGEGALMTMLQSCSPGLVVVNIDNGFGAGATAALIARRVAKERGREKDR